MPKAIEKTLLSAIMEGRIAPGSRLSENELAEAFGVSRTKIREALLRLEARHVVSAQARKGWFVTVPDATEAAQIFAARRCVEYGFLSTTRPFDAARIARIAAHLDDERRAIAEHDKGLLTYLMGDFHVCIVAQSGNPSLIEIMRNLTARTIMISLRYQSEQNALASHEDHKMIFEALAAGDMLRAAQLSVTHLDDVEAGLVIDCAPTPLETLRNTLRLDAVSEGAPPEKTA